MWTEVIMEVQQLEQRLLAQGREAASAENSLERYMVFFSMLETANEIVRTLENFVTAS